LSEFVLVIDPLEHLKKLQSCSGHHVGGKPLYQEAVLFQVSHPGLFSINPTRPNEPVVSTNSQRDYNEDLSIVIDTGASWSVTPFLMDFVSSINESCLDSLHSLDGQIQVCGKGTVQWTVQDQMGVVRTLRHTGLYVPRASVRLFSLQWWWDVMYSAGNRIDLERSFDSLRTLAPTIQLALSSYPKTI
jgi:hypothetical protein